MARCLFRAFGKVSTVSDCLLVEWPKLGCIARQHIRFCCQRSLSCTLRSFSPGDRQKKVAPKIPFFGWLDCVLFSCSLSLQAVCPCVRCLRVGSKGERKCWLQMLNLDSLSPKERQEGGALRVRGADAQATRDVLGSNAKEKGVLIGSRLTHTSCTHAHARTHKPTPEGSGDHPTASARPQLAVASVHRADVSLPYHRVSTFQPLSSIGQVPEAKAPSHGKRWSASREVLSELLKCDGKAAWPTGQVRPTPRHQHTGRVLQDGATENRARNTHFSEPNLVFQGSISDRYVG